MLNKRFLVKIELKLHAITCPGVWLCTHGYLEATIKTLGYYFRTGAMEPRFPLLCHDTFNMEGYFKSVGTLDALERVLAAEQVEIALWQNGRRLAYFLGRLSDVVRPTVTKSCQHDINVELLMRATPAFPGIIAPKVEMSAQVGVRNRLSHETATRRDSTSSAHTNFISPNLDALNTMRPKNRHCQQSNEGIGGSCFAYLEERRKQHPVCHTKAPPCRFTQQVNCCDEAKDYASTQGRHKNVQRRLSTCSSFSNSYALSQVSQNSNNSSVSNSCCCPSLSNITGATATAAEEHQQRCEICLSYRKAFLS